MDIERHLKVGRAIGIDDAATTAKFQSMPESNRAADAAMSDRDFWALLATKAKRAAGTKNGEALTKLAADELAKIGA